MTYEVYVLSYLGLLSNFSYSIRPLNLLEEFTLSLYHVTEVCTRFVTYCDDVNVCAVQVAFSYCLSSLGPSILKSTSSINGQAFSSKILIVQQTLGTVVLHIQALKLGP